MDSTIAAPSGDGNPFPHKDISLTSRQSPCQGTADPVHHLARCMTAAQMEAGRKLGLVRSKYLRLRRKIEKDLDRLSRYACELGLPAHQLSSCAGNQVEASAGTRPPAELVGLETRDIYTPSLRSLSSGEEKKENPPLRESSLRARTKRVLEDLGPPEFQAWYQEYVRHTARQKGLDAWRQLNPSPELAARMTEAARLQRENNFAGPDAAIPPYPATWINGERWLDQIVPVRRKLPPAMQAVQDYADRKAKEAANGTPRRPSFFDPPRTQHLLPDLQDRRRDDPELRERPEGPGPEPDQAGRQEGG